MQLSKLWDDFDDGGQLVSIAPIAPSARLNPTVRRRRNHLEVCKSCMTKVTKVSTLSMGQTQSIVCERNISAMLSTNTADCTTLDRTASVDDHQQIKVAENQRPTVERKCPWLAGHWPVGSVLRWRMQRAQRHALLSHTWITTPWRTRRTVTVGVTLKTAHVCLIGFRWGSIGEGSTVSPTLVDPCTRPRAPKAREARGHGSTSVGPTVDPSPMDPHLIPIKHTWALKTSLIVLTMSSKTAKCSSQIFYELLTYFQSHDTRHGPAYLAFFRLYCWCAKTRRCRWSGWTMWKFCAKITRKGHLDDTWTPSKV